MNRRRSRGQALVEMALILPILLIMFMGIWDFGRAIFSYNQTSNAARDAIRAAVVNQDATVVRTKALAASSGLVASDVTVTGPTFSPCTAASPVIGCLVTVTVSYQWSPITPIIGNIVPGLSLSTTTSMPIERVYSNPTP